LDREWLARFMTLPTIFLLDIVSIGFSIYLIIISLNLSMLIIAIIFLILTVIAAFFNTMAAFSYYDSYFYEKRMKKEKNIFGKIKRYYTSCYRCTYIQ